MNNSMKFSLSAFAIGASLFSATAFADTQAWTLSKNKTDLQQQAALADQLDAPQNRLAQVKNQYFVELNATELKSLKRGDALSVPLPSGLQNFVVTKREINASGTQSITARPQNLADGGFAIITLGENIFHLTAQGNDVLYTGRGENSVGLLVAETDYKELLPALETDERYVPRQLPSAEESKLKQEWRDRNEQSEQKNGLQKQAAMTEQAEETAIIDVLFYYTTSTNDLYNNNPQSRIDHIVSITNFILSTSNVDAQIRATSQEIDYVESDVGTGLDDMTERNGAFANLTEDRFLAGADAVALLHPIDPDDSACGVAYVLDPRQSIFSEYALSANGIDCQDYVVAHELGHNFGLNHSRKQGDVGTTFEYALGHGVDDTFHTVMAYQSAYDTSAVGIPQAKYLFSDPELSCGSDLACGIAEGEPDSAHASKALRAVVQAAANARAADPDTTLASDVIAQVEDAELAQCLSDNLDNNSEYAASWTSLNCRIYAIDDFSQLANFSGLKELELFVPRDIDFSFLNDMPQLQSLIVRADIGIGHTVTNIDALADKTNLTFLWLEQFKLTSISFLSNLTQLQVLVLDHNLIEDFSPLANLTNLWYLSLNDAKVGDGDLRVVEGMSKLETLSAMGKARNSIFQVDDIQFPTSIETLQFTYSKMVTAPNISDLPNLTFLSLGSSLEDISNIGHSNTISYLAVGGEELSNFSVLAGFPNVTTLRVQPSSAADLNFLNTFAYLNSIWVRTDKSVDLAPALLHATREPTEFFAEDQSIRLFYSRAACWQEAYAQVLNTRDNLLVNYSGYECFTDDDYADYDGDGIPNMLEVDNGLNPLRADSDGDGVNDTLGSSNVLDVDGDGKADLFVRNTDTFYNYGLASADGSTKRVVFGLNSGDIPVYGDFDGDGVTDLAVRRPSSFMWYVQNSSDPGPRGDFIQRVQFGLAEEDIPVPADYDGDGITDFAVRRPSTQMWYIQTSSGEGGDRGDGIMRVNFGLDPNDIPVVGDYDGDGKADIAVRRPSTQMWYILNSSNGEIQRIRFGLAEEDIPVPADYDGDGITDLAVRRPSTQMWYIMNSSGEPGPYGDGIQRIRFGLDPADIPIVDDYDGDGKADIAVRRASTQMQYILTSSGEGGDRGDGIMRVRFGLQEKYVPFQAPIHIRMQMVEANNR